MKPVQLHTKLPKKKKDDKMYEVHSQLPTLLVHVPLYENPASAVENCQCSHLAQKYLHLWTAVKPEIPDVKNMHLWKGTARSTLEHQ